MKTLKAFTPFKLSSEALYEWCGRAAKSNNTANVIAKFIAQDPDPTSWNSMGLTTAIDSLVHDLDGTARMLMYQFNDRILPGTVRDEELKKEVQRISELEGRPLNKKEYAELKEDVEYRLLPKAFIRRSLVPVMVFKDALMIFTSSAKKCESVLRELVALTGDRNIDFSATWYETKGTIGEMLKDIAVDGLGEIDGVGFGAMSSAVLRGENKRTIRIKDRDIEGAEVQTLLSSEAYGVSELQMGYFLSDHPTLTFTLTDKWVLKALKLDDVTLTAIEGDADDAHASAWLHAKTFGELLGRILGYLNSYPVKDQKKTFDPRVGALDQDQDEEL